MKKKKVYFVSDVHLGMYPPEDSAHREKIFVSWLNEIMPHTSELYLLGDIFDYWYEYRKVVPRGFTRTLGKLAEMSDNGIKIHYFTGNHDVWVFDYLPGEIGITLHHTPYTTEIEGKKFYLAHGDGLGPGDVGFKLLKGAFRNKILQWLYSRIHPNVTISLAHYWSRKSRYGKENADEFQGEDKELMYMHAKKMLEKEHFDFFIFGHRHIMVDMPINEMSRYINLGEWISMYSFAEFDGRDLKLKTYQG